jgi:endoglucanase
MWRLVTAFNNFARATFLLLAPVLCASSGRAEIDYRGVNLSAAAFGHYSDSDASLNHFPGVYGTDYVYPTNGDFDYFHSLGMNTFRIPFRWERIQPTLGGALDTDELARLQHVVDYVTGFGGNVILDVHNYARYSAADGMHILGVDLANSTFADLWSRLATTFGNRNGVIFGLMNEPHIDPPISLSTERVVSFTNDALSAIRATGATNLALVEGNGYSGGHSWEQNWYGTPNSVAMLNVVDPGHNMAFEVHQYVDNNPGFDSDYSGTTDNVESATVAADKLVDFTDWLRANGLRGFLGELGTPASDLGVQAMYNGVNFVEQNADVWMGWTLWSGGPWWDGADDAHRYILSLNPLSDGSTAPQLAVLEPFLAVPEPGTGALVTTGGLALALAYCRRSRRN